MKIQAIIPAAGLGTRFFPITKTIPKEMLPILNKPAIQYVIEEGVAANISDFIMIINHHKTAIMNYFDSSFMVEQLIKEKNKNSGLDDLLMLCNSIRVSYIDQEIPLGLGHAVSLAAHLIDEEYVSILLPDDIIISAHAGIGQLIEVAQREKASVIAVQEVPRESVSSYGIVGIRKQINNHLSEISYVIEKPQPDSSPSQLGIIGRYVLSRSVFNALSHISKGIGNELQLTDAIDYMLSKGERIIACKVQGTRYDTGTPLGLLQANMALGLNNPLY